MPNIIKVLYLHDEFGDPVATPSDVVYDKESGQTLDEHIADAVKHGTYVVVSENADQTAAMADALPPNALIFEKSEGDDDDSIITVPLLSNQADIYAAFKAANAPVKAEETASIGTSQRFALEDHVHPEQALKEEEIIALIKKYATPIGHIDYFAYNDIEEGYSICDGGELSRTEHADLFAKIGTLHGAGDGKTTFNKPNLIDKFIQGSATAGTVKAAGLPNITGTMTKGLVGDTTTIGATGSGAYQSGGSGDGTGTLFGSKGTRIAVNFDASKSNSIYGSSSTVQPPAVTMVPCIKISY